MISTFPIPLKEADVRLRTNKEPGIATPIAPIATTNLEKKHPEILGTHPSSLSDYSTLDKAEGKSNALEGTLGKDSTYKSQLSSFTSISIYQWNARSLQSSTKINFLKGLPADIITIQEVWQRSNNIHQIGEELNITVRTNNRAGGTATLNKSGIKIQVMKKHQLNKDYSAIKIRFLNRFMWLVNVYIPEGTCAKVQKLFGKLRSTIPINEWKILCILGDFNINIKNESFESQLLKSLCKQMGLNINIPDLPTRKGATLDYLITGSEIRSEGNQVVPSPSDHQAIGWILNIKPLKPAKSIRIPNREFADDLMHYLISSSKVTNSKSFLEHLSKVRSENPRMIMKTLKPRRDRNLNLLNKLLSIDNFSHVSSIINHHWTKFWQNTEEIRYSNDSQHAYRRFKNILKYHLFQKRDGGIIHSILKENGVITDDQDEIEKLLLKTMEEIQIDNKWGWIEKKPFPRLERINQEDMENLLRTLATNKAIAFDATSDILFKATKIFDLEEEEEKTNLEKTAAKLRNIWRIDLDEISNMEDTWDARLVPLNKVFPQTPTRGQLRPIIIQSPIVKILEARFSKKLHEYLDNKLDRAQVGFVRKLGVQINLARALQRITLRTSRKQTVYGVFIDFSHAYNSVPHTLLFQKLRKKKVLSEDEISFLEQLYARYSVKLGHSRLRSNKGVAQGSVISPALFNIFIEDLSSDLREGGDVNIEDLLFYADDILILCTSPNQVEKCIKIVEKWCTQNGMKLNKDKSGIVVFADRRAQKIPKMELKSLQGNRKKEKAMSDWTVSQKSIQGIPLCKSYKYLGTFLTSKLSCGPQIGYIKKKTAHLFTKLYAYLANASADARRDLWQTMVTPLYNAAFALLYFEPSQTHKENLERIRRCSFKQWMMISKRTNSVLTNDMIRKNLPVLSETTVETCIEQWKQRRNFMPVSISLPNLTQKNGLRGVPNSWCELINTHVKPCPKCKKPGVVTNRWHLKYCHGIELMHINAIWRKQICPITEMEVEKELKDGTKVVTLLKRHKVKELLEPIILKHLREYNQAIAGILKS